MKYKLSDIAEINPRESLPKGKIAKKVSMDILQPFCRDIPTFSLEAYNGGTKFRNGDTIMARITPCLENGKTARVSILDDGEVGFGSTEYIVFRAKSGICDPNYLYYLICSPFVRDPAVKSMVGSSNRQRVQTDAVENLILDIPSLQEQSKIGGVLKAIDDKIAINRAINDNLAELLQSVYRQQFSAYLQDGRLSDICDYSNRRIAISALSLSSYYSTENMLPNKAGAVKASSLPAIAQTTRASAGDVLVSNIRPYFKKIVYCQRECGCSADVLCFTPKLSTMSAFLYSVLYADRFFDFMVAGSKGTKMPRGDKQQIMTYPIHKPSEEELSVFNELALPILAQIEQHRAENMRLTTLRDSLLPKLMSGEIDVSEVEF